MNVSPYSNSPQTATISPSPSRQGFRKMPSNGTATRTATQERLYRIGEVSRLADLKPFVLRYWETEFPMLEPVKTSGGRRLYRQEDVDMVFRIKRLLYDEGFTIAGARRHLREKPGAGDFESAAVGNADARAEGKAHLLSRKMLLDMRDALRAFLTLLERR
jgi:DNA-binding transcriptional MerR regulator